MILSMLDKPEGLIQRVTDRQGHDRRYALDCSKLRDLGWTPLVQFEAGLADTLAWYRDNAWWWTAIKHHDAGYKTYYQTQYASR
jgi:dTDP-glucose 4,6-dehydratase